MNRIHTWFRGMLSVVKHKHICCWSLCCYNTRILWHIPRSEKVWKSVRKQLSKMHVSLEPVIFFKYFCAEREGGRGGGGRWAFYNWRVTLRKIEFGSLNKKTKKMWLHFIIYLFTSPSWLILISMSILPVTEPNPPNSVKQNKKGT